jgi:hypothetical protein
VAVVTAIAAVTQAENVHDAHILFSLYGWNTPRRRDIPDALPWRALCQARPLPGPPPHRKRGYTQAFGEGRRRAITALGPG